MTYSFHRGALALDFVGTVGARASSQPRERMGSAADLGRWLDEAGLGGGTTATERDLVDARALREAIWALACARIDGRGPGRADLAIVNAAAGALRLGAPRLTPSFTARWESKAPVALSLGRIAAGAIELLSRDADRLTRCELDGCGALLLSRSRNEPRRWCSMETCGNRAKVKAFRARQARGRAGPR